MEAFRTLWPPDSMLELVVVGVPAVVVGVPLVAAGAVVVMLAGLAFISSPVGAVGWPLLAVEGFTTGRPVVGAFGALMSGFTLLSLHGMRGGLGGRPVPNPRRERR